MPKYLLSVVSLLPLVGSLYGQACVPEVKFEPMTKPLIRDVAFQNAPSLSPRDQEKISQVVRITEVPIALLKPDLGGVPEEGAELVRRAYQNDGYFKVQVEGKAVRVTGDPQRRYDIVIRVLQEGQQYRLGDVHFVHATVFSELQLRDLFPIQRSEIFSREKIANGLDQLGRVYDAQGYLNYTGVPETELDDNRAIADLKIDVDEGKQFRLRSVEILGVDPETKARLLDELSMKPGDVYTSEAWERAIRKFPNLAPELEPNTTAKRLDERNGWVDMVLDFRKPNPCPGG